MKGLDLLPLQLNSHIFASRLMVGKPLGKQTFGKQKDNIKNDLREIGCDGVNLANGKFWYYWFYSKSISRLASHLT
jgi:hypothetical protein